MTQKHRHNCHALLQAIIALRDSPSTNRDTILGPAYVIVSATEWDHLMLLVSKSKPVTSTGHDA